MAYAYYTLPSVPVMGFANGTPAGGGTVVMTPMAPLSEEELVHGELSKRCVRCGTMYRRGEEFGCKIHTGQYYGLRASVWTCCRKLLERDVGCVDVSHLEDEKAMDQMMKFVYLTNQAESKRTVTASMLPGGVEGPGYGKKRVVRADNEPKDGVVVHTVLPTDTMDGICLKYDLSKAELIKANRGLSSASFPAYRKILIPVGDAEVILTEMLSPEEKRKLEEERLKVKFSRQFKISGEEASAYLSANSYDFELASQDFKDDTAFETSLTSPQATPTPAPKNNFIFSSRSTKFTPLPSNSPVATPSPSTKR